MKKIIIIACLFFVVGTSAQTALPVIKIAANHRFFQTADGKPFFWLGDTGWLLFIKCSNEETIRYLETRKQQGFNVVQVMVLHALNDVDTQGDSALANKNIATPKTNGPGSSDDYWAHIDFVIQQAARRGMYMALVPLWGGNVKDGKITVQQATAYANFLATRYGKYSNIIWMNGGDIKGSDAQAVWNAIGTTLKKYDDRHLVSFHPRGRNSSSEWFHAEPWLDFNMIQSGHKDYAQDTSSNETNHYGEDNWKFVNTDYKRLPAKPTLDAEPSYENIPHGLHDSLQPRWTAADVRRYAYWSVFAGAAGFTYGENAVMQFHTGPQRGSFGVTGNWQQTIQATGAGQMKYLAELMLSNPYFERIPAQDILRNNTGSQYEYVLATKGKNYAMAYACNGQTFSIDCNKLGFTIKKAGWFNPRDGQEQPAENIKSKGIVAFDPPGEPGKGNDWVLVLK